MELSSTDWIVPMWSSDWPSAASCWPASARAAGSTEPLPMAASHVRSNCASAVASIVAVSPVYRRGGILRVELRAFTSRLLGQ